jgi:hypothetical protein
MRRRSAGPHDRFPRRRKIPRKESSQLKGGNEMSLPNPKHTKPGAAILTAPSTPGGAAVIAQSGDCVVHESGAGWHVCCVPLGATATVPLGGLPLGQSTDQFHWSQGASYSGMGVPSSYSPAGYDAAQSGYGSDGRINGSSATGKPSF